MLTRNQAGFLRAVLNDCIETELRELGLIDGFSDIIAGNNAERLLAEYDATFETVERSELAELRRLHDRIDDFFDFAMIGDNQIEFGEEGGLCVRWVQVPDDDWGYWVVDPGEKPEKPDAWPWHAGGWENCGNALSEAFRVFCAKCDAAEAAEVSDAT